MGGRKKETAEAAEARLDDGKWLTTGAVAVLLGVDRGTVNYWLKIGHTPTGLKLRAEVDAISGYRACNPQDVRVILAAKRAQDAERAESAATE